ncbi:ribonuclease HII [Amaricoccus macauensis]|uniref:ribonuclease HII n=1 Tax=Amaricoccus macauensis TaxID=57001 RepID=UPI003C7D148B
MTGALPDFTLESSAHDHGARTVCGVDEAGRGPWAGPIVAAAVVLDPANIPPGLNDSKKVSAKRRDALFEKLAECAQVGVGQASVDEISAYNVSRAGYLAMRRAIAELPQVPDLALVDGRHAPPGLGCNARAFIGGDGRSLSIAAASIVAKVTRDRIMVALSQQFPGYGWENNKGYGTRAHVSGLASLGVTPHHRKTFRPIHDMLWQQAETDFESR